MTFPLKNLDQVYHRVTPNDNEGSMFRLLRQLSWVVIVFCLGMLILMMIRITEPPKIQEVGHGFVRPADKAEIIARLNRRRMPMNTPVSIEDKKVRYHFYINGRWERL